MWLLRLSWLSFPVISTLRQCYRGSSGQELRLPAGSHARAPSWKWTYQSLPSLRMTIVPANILTAIPWETLRRGSQGGTPRIPDLQKVWASKWSLSWATMLLGNLLTRQQIANITGPHSVVIWVQSSCFRVWEFSPSHPPVQPQHEASYKKRTQKRLLQSPSTGECSLRLCILPAESRVLLKKFSMWGRSTTWLVCFSSDRKSLRKLINPASPTHLIKDCT